MRVVVSSSHIVSAAPSCSGGELLTLYPCSSMRSFPQDTVLNEFQRRSFPRVAAFHKLLQPGSLPWGAVPQEQAAPAWVPHRVTSPASKPALAWAPLSKGPGRNLLQCRLPTGSQPPPGIPCSDMGSSLGCRWVSAPLWASMGCRDTACLTMVCSRGCRGTSALAPGAPPAPPSALIVVSAGLVLSHSLTPLSCCRFFFFIPFKYVIPEALQPSLMGSALASGGSVLELHRT